MRRRAWSPDGSWIAYGFSPLPAPGIQGFHTVLYRMEADGSNPTRWATPIPSTPSRRSHLDGTEVLFQRYLGEGEPAPLLTLDLDTGVERVVVEAGALNPAWSPDGSRIVMQTDPREPGGDWGPLVTIDASGDPATAARPLPGRGGERRLQAGLVAGWALRVVRLRIERRDRRIR